MFFVFHDKLTSLFHCLSLLFGNDWVSGCGTFEVKGVNDRGKGRKTWDECVKKDLVALHLVWIVLTGGVLYAETVQPVQAWTTDVKRR